MQLDAMLPTPVVEPRFTLEPEVHLAADAEHPPDQVPPGAGIAVDGHEVLHLADTVGRQGSA